MHSKLELIWTAAMVAGGHMGSRKNKMQWVTQKNWEEYICPHAPPLHPTEEFPAPSFTDLDVTVEASCGPTPY